MPARISKLYEVLDREGRPLGYMDLALIESQNLRHELVALLASTVDGHYLLQLAGEQFGPLISPLPAGAARLEQAAELLIPVFGCACVDIHLAATLPMRRGSAPVVAHLFSGRLPCNAAMLLDQGREDLILADPADMAALLTLGYRPDPLLAGWNFPGNLAQASS